jgi:hypothetical protein
VDIPLIAPLRQRLDQPVISDVAAEVKRCWGESNVRTRLRPGNRVAVAVGSRGIANLAAIVRSTIESLREMGAQPFVVAAMGSHGGATSEGQRQLLADYGVTEAALGVPVKTEMETVRLGVNPWDEPVYWDKNAWEADAVVTVSRIKAHTDFRGRYESGIVKMLAIGLGKREGAAQHHRWGIRGVREMMPETARFIVERSKFIAGLAILENADEKTSHLKVVDRDVVFDEEPRLLEQAKAIMGRLPFDQIDLLVIGEIGKNYSGAGIDPNVVGRLFMEGEPEFVSPRVTRICALDLSPETHGNATGIGLADLTTDRLLSRIDPVPTRVNQMTACSLLRSKLPFGFPSDRACIEAGLATCWQPNFSKVRMAIIPNTLELAETWVTAPLVAEACERNELVIEGDLRPVPFDAHGTLQQQAMFPRSVRGRRPSA